MITFEGIEDVRTNGQIGNELAYDVGEAVFGSKKEIAQLREELRNTIGLGSVSKIMCRLEEINPGLAAKYCIKENVLNTFNFEEEQQNGVEIDVAVIKKMILDRVGTKPSGKDSTSRELYIRAAEEIQQTLKNVKTFDELKETRTILRRRLLLEKPVHLDKQLEYLAYAKEQAIKEPSQTDLERRKYMGRDEALKPIYVDLTLEEWKERVAERVAEVEASIAMYYENVCKPLYVLGDKFANFFLDSESANRTIKTVRQKKLKWNEYLTFDTTKKKDRVPSGTRQKEWERKVEDPYFRTNGRPSSIQIPEEAMIQFGLRAIQFGHWLDDASGKFHLVKTAEALQDLADFLGISDEEISCGGKLAIAFGSRGSGGKKAAAAHYEPAMKVINMTKENSPGTLGHEMAHFFDNVIQGHSEGHDTIEFASEGLGPRVSEDLRSAYSKLMDAIVVGDGSSKCTLKVMNLRKKFTSIFPSRKSAVGNEGLSINLVKRFSESIEESCSHGKFYYQGLLEKELNKTSASAERYRKKLKNLETKRKKELNLLYQELMYHQEQITGENVEFIEVPAEGSEYFNRMKELDGSRKSYYSKKLEMFARVFESWLESEMDKLGKRNHYLVCGTREQMVTALGAPFPKGSERVMMFECMGVLIRTAVKEGLFKTQSTIGNDL